MRRCATAARPLLLLAAAAALIALASAADRALTAPFYDPGLQRFPLKDAWLLAVPGHAGLKWAMLLFWAGCLLAGGAWRRGAVFMAMIAIVVALLKHLSPWSCPWDLPDYGGSDAGAGRCLPAAHPVVGFALFGLYAALGSRARGVLWAGWIVGLGAGAVQVARGAHFASHVLWSAWVAWAVTLALAALTRRRASP